MHRNGIFIPRFAGILRIVSVILKQRYTFSLMP